jgi:iron complex transport system substrate-binding protein
MKHYIIYSIPVVLIIFLLLSSFAGNKEELESGVTDEAGRTIEIPGEIRSIVSLSPSNTEILFALGAGDLVTGVTEFCNYPPQAQSRSHVGGFADVSIEKIVALQPDIIFASHFHISKMIPALENLGFTTVVTNPPTVHAVFSSIEFVGRLCKKESEARLLVAGLKEKYSQVTARIKGKERASVFWELSEDYWTIGKGSFLDDLIHEAGGRNIARELDAPWLQLSSEFIVNANPQVIFLADQPGGVTAEDVKKRPGWESLAAVTGNRIIVVSPDMNDKVSRAGPRIIEALEYVAGELHPIELPAEGKTP